MIKLNKILRLSTLFLVGMAADVVAGGGEMPAFAPVQFANPNAENVALGHLLFFDPILSGNQNIACATCHHPKFATSDGVSLAIGEGGVGLGPDRVFDPDNPPEQRIGRNAPALFNLGAGEFTRLFHDGRLENDPARASGIRTPLAQDMVSGFNNVLAAQAMFPVLSGDEMAGHYSESDVSQAVRQGILARQGGAWDIIAARVESIPDYRARFDKILGPDPLEFSDIANMIADFIAVEWRADDSPFDRYLLGEPLRVDAEAGRDLFYGAAGCSVCHAGRFQSDQAFHAIAMPQIGPGKAARFETHHRDTGRMRVTGAVGDAYKFRTPSLRNIANTSPYGHDGAFATLEGVVRHHLDPVVSLRAYDPSQAVFPDFPGAEDFAILQSPSEMQAIEEANELMPVRLNDNEINQLLAFLNALTDHQSLYGRLGVPDHVPSGLPVDR